MSGLLGVHLPIEETTGYWHVRSGTFVWLECGHLESTTIFTCTCNPSCFQAACNRVVWSLLTLTRNCPSTGSQSISYNKINKYRLTWALTNIPFTPDQVWHDDNNCVTLTFKLVRKILWFNYSNKTSLTELFAWCYMYILYYLFLRISQKLSGLSVNL